MNAESTSPSSGEIVDEISKWTVGGGILTLALFPLAVPILVLTAFAALPLLLLVLAAGLLVAAVALPILLIRRIGGRAIGGRRPRGTTERGESHARRVRFVTHLIHIHV